MDVLGAGTATTLAATGLDDLIGFRRGFLLPSSGNATCCKVPGKGRDYSNEIQTADLKIAGLARRLDLSVGPLRYLLFSVTYGTKSYPSGLPELRERQVGFEIGLNLAPSSWTTSGCGEIPGGAIRCMWSSTTSGYRLRPLVSGTI